MPIDTRDDVDGRGLDADAQHLLDRGCPDGPHHSHRVAVLGDLDRVRLGEFAHDVGVVLVEIPGVPLGRGVAEHLQQVAGAALRQHFTVGDEVAHRDEQTIPVDGRANESVEQLETVGVLADERPAAISFDGAAQCLSRAYGIGTGVEADRRITRPGKKVEALGDEPLEGHGEFRVVPLGFAMHPGDRRARQDVVELLQKHRVPGLLERVVGILDAEPHVRECRPQFRLSQEVFAATIATLGLRLRGVGSAMELEIQLALPHRTIRVLRLGRLEELPRPTHGHPR